MTDHLTKARDLAPGAVDPSERFSRYGLDSLGAAKMIADLGAHLGRSLSATLVWEYPSIDALAAFLTASPAATEKSRQRRTAPARRASDAVEPIAVCGLSCRLPGSNTPAAFWDLLREGRSAVDHVPDGRWDERVLRDSAVGAEERAKVKRGAFLDRVDGFDPLFFGISPREAASMDPQQRLLLELVWEALDDAGIPPSSIKGTDASVYIGAIWSDYALVLQQAGINNIGPYTVTGTHHSILANRISYLLGANGPSFSIDSACSSGLVIAHLAAESLRSGESTTAIIGAVNLDLLPESALGVARFGALSQDGACYTFDARANGYVRGEGGGVLVLKRLSAAIADGNPIYCVLRGSAVNNDGASNGLTAPNPKAQEAVLRKAYERAGVDPRDVQYVEAHGTGTPLGDPIEARALGAVVGSAHPAGNPLFIGSLKTNIGHLEGAAGIAGLLKMALSIQHRQLPPSRNFAVPNPHLDLPSLHLSVVDTLRPWPAPHKRLLAGISSFGLGGTNAHVVVEEWPGPRAEIVALPGDTHEEQRRFAADLRASIDGADALTSLRSLAARAHRQAHDKAHRSTVVARSTVDLRKALDRWLSVETSDEASRLDLSKGPVFVFPGQGAQWHGMALTLLHEEPVFRTTLERCDAAIRRELGWSLLEELTCSSADSRLSDIEVSLPAIISIDIAVSEWWRSMGVAPAAVVGHSTGEIAAAHVCGALDLDDTMTVICAYGSLITRLSDRGGMALVGLPWDESERVLAGFEGRVFRAIADSAEATVLAGEPSALAALVDTVSRTGVFCRRVAMNVSPHCPLVDELRDELHERLRGIRPRKSRIPLISEVTGKEIPGEQLDAAHWVKNFGDPAFFSRAVDELIARGHRLFIDVGPHPITKHSVETNLRSAGVTGRVLSSLRREEDERTTLLDSLGQVSALGAKVDWRALYATASERDSGANPGVLVLSAKSRDALAQSARAFRAWLSEGPDARFEDILYTCAVRRDHHKHRLGVVGANATELCTALAAAAEGRREEGVALGEAMNGRPRVVLVLPGQGSQWLGMGRQLYREEPAFRDAIDLCDAAIARESGFSVVTEIHAGEAESRLGEIDVVQPLLFAIEVALGALWQAWGVEPACVIGHSMGEAAAAYLAGILTMEDAAKVICRRSKLLRRQSGRGAMALVELTRKEAERALAGEEALLSVAVSNGPRSTVISGDAAAIDRLLTTLEAQGVFCRRVKVDVASHSPQMDELTADLLTALADVAPRKGRIPLRSTVTGEILEGPEMDAHYWVQNLRRPVLFGAAVARTLEDGPTLFVELSPHPLLLPSIQENIAEERKEGAALASTRRNGDERRAMLSTLAEIHVRGLAIDWTRQLPGGGRVVATPTYPWTRDRYWADRDNRPSAGSTEARVGHPLIGQLVVASDRPNAHYWDQWIDIETLGYLADHRVQGSIVFPGACYVEMALAAAGSMFEGEAIILENFVMDQVLHLTEGEPRRVQLAVIGEEGVQAGILVSSHEATGTKWTRHAWVTARAALGEDAPFRPPEDIRARCPRRLTGDEHAARMAARKIDFGPAFRGLTEVWLGDDEALGHVVLPESAGAASAYNVHPALLDACFQAAATLLDDDGNDTWVPAAIDRIQLLEAMPSEVWVHVTWAGDVPRGDFAALDLLVVDDEGRPLVEVERLWLKKLARLELPDVFAGCAYATDWVPSALPTAMRQELAEPGDWLVLSDDGGVGAEVADALRRDGHRVIEFLPGREHRALDADRYLLDPATFEGFEETLREVAGHEGARIHGILHFWSLDATPASASGPERILADIQLGAVTVLSAVQAVMRCALRDPPRLVLVTRGAQPAGGSEYAVCPSGAAVWGFARVLAAEHPEFNTVRIDMDPEVRSFELMSVIREIVADTPEDQIALRGDARLVARLARYRLGVSEELTFQGDGTYLITGGLTGLGLSLARWMVRQGARNLVLLGRRGPSDEAKQALVEMEKEGASVLVRSADVSMPEDLARVLDEVRRELPPLRGVVHSAAVLEDASVYKMTEQGFWPPVLPKAIGAWNLHVQTLDDPLEFFVMYSSVASLIGSPGQANYAAANAFVDALAHVRRAMGLPGTAIQWGPFSEVGLAAASESRGQRLSLRGIQSFTPDEGHRLLSRVLRHPVAEIGLIRMTVRQLFDFYPRLALAPFLDQVRQEEAHSQSRQTSEARFRSLIVGTPPEERRAAVEKHIVEHVERVLRLPAGRIDPEQPFLSYGMDSLMSLEIRHRLEASFNLRLSAAVLYTYPNISMLVSHLMTEMAIDTTTPQPIVAAGAMAFPEITDEMSENTAAQMLDEKLLDLEDYLK
ncbi:MAG: type I polyketide synthase [Polyangiaceae bacterium]